MTAGKLIEAGHGSGRIRTCAETVRVVGNILALLHPDLHNHCRRVGHGVKALALAMDLDREEVQMVLMAALIHDMGYLGSDKPVDEHSTESGQNSRIYDDHPKIGAELLNKAPDMAQIREIILHHHEHYNGSGFPDRISGDKIPLGARILAVVDFYERITVVRDDSGHMEPAEAELTIREDANIIYDPEVVKVFVGKVLPSGIMDPVV